jgi:hypothetical protein
MVGFVNLLILLPDPLSYRDNGESSVLAALPDRLQHTIGKTKD